MAVFNDDNDFDAPISLTIDQLPDGQYEVIADGRCHIKPIKQGPGGIVTVPLKILAGPEGFQKGGETITQEVWIKGGDRRARDQFLVDLKRLGFDVDEWGQPGSDRKFSNQIEGAVAALRGLRFRVKKTSSPKKDKPGEFWHNLNWLGRTLEDGHPIDLKPAKLGPNEYAVALAADEAEVAAGDSDPFSNPSNN